MSKLYFKSLFISDTHLGTSTAQIDKLLLLLKNVECEQIFLVGDIIDLMRLKKRFYWPKKHNDVVRRILKLASKGVEVIYIPGNHDDRIRDYLGLNIGNVTIKPYEIHTTKLGKKLLITHGDQFDLVVMNSPLLSFFGAIAYDMLIKINRTYNGFCTMIGLREMSLSQKIKTKVKAACKYISHFETLLAKQAREFQVDGVVCGHIHRPEINTKDFHGIEYYNCGDWVESCTCLVEHSNGNIELLDYESIKHYLRLRSESFKKEQLLNPKEKEEDLIYDDSYQMSLKDLLDAPK